VSNIRCVRERLRAFLAPEATPEPALTWRRGTPALASFGLWVVLLAPPAAAVLVVIGREPAAWLMPLVVGLPAFACAFLLPRGRRRRLGLAVCSLDVILILVVVLFVVLFLIAEANCPPDAYECPV
jgi:hypothetical protein